MLTMLPWDKNVAWPKFKETTLDGSARDFDVPEWASRLAGLGHWMVSSGTDGQFYRCVVIVPVRNTAVTWVTLGALMASLADSNTRAIQMGDTVWFPPRRGRVRFSKGAVAELPADNVHGLFRIERLGARNDRTIDSCSRDGFFAVENSPNLDSARSAERMAVVARRFGIQCTPDRCLMLENAIGITGSKDQVRSAAGGIELDGITIAGLIMLEENGFSMCRHLGGRRAKPDDKARLVVIDGPDGLNILEDEAFKRADIPAVAILTPDEWISGQPDPDRITNAMEDWRGDICEQWPRELEMPSLGCLLYRKDSSR